METLKQKDLQEEIRSALSRENSLERREQRELRKAEATGRISSFLRSRASSDETLRASLALAEANNPSQFAQATIQYQKAVETSRTSISPRIEQSQPDPQTILPPRPDDNVVYNLTTQNTELSWREGGGTIDTSHPFKVITKNIGGDQYWGILEKSYAWTSLSPSDQGTVTGLLTTGVDNDPNWIQIPIGTDYLYLEYDQENFETRIFSVGNGGILDPFINDVQQPENWLVLELNGSIADFKFARKIIAKSEFDGENLTITQFVRNHQLLEDICFNGNPARYWFDFGKGNT